MANDSIADDFGATEGPPSGFDDPPPAGNVPQRRFALVRFKDIKFGTAPRCIIEDLIPRESLVVVWGPPKCGKSFFVFDLVLHVALGWEYRGKQVEQGVVVYIAAEGRQRRIAEDGADPPFYLLTTRLDLVEDIDELVADIKAQLPGDRCLIIVIDTLNRTIHGSESKDEDMGAYRDGADRLREEFHSTVIIIHHCGIDGTRPRGHTSLTGALDAQFAARKDVDKTILVELELMKDGEAGEMMRMGLEVVHVGIDDNGKSITSCVIQHLDAPAADRRGRRKKLSPAQNRALALLNEAIAKAGEIPPASDHVPSGTQCVREKLWRAYCDQGAISEGTTPDAKQKAFKRAADVLVDEGRVGKWEPWVWVV